MAVDDLKLDVEVDSGAMNELKEILSSLVEINNTIEANLVKLNTRIEEVVRNSVHFKTFK